MATIENERLETKAAAGEAQHIFTVSAESTAQPGSAERYLMAAWQRKEFVLTQAELTPAVVSASGSLMNPVFPRGIFSSLG